MNFRKLKTLVREERKGRERLKTKKLFLRPLRSSRIVFVFNLRLLVFICGLSFPQKLHGDSTFYMWMCFIAH